MERMRFLIKEELKNIAILKENKNAVLSLIIVFVFVDALFIGKRSDMEIFGVLAFYILSIKIFKLTSKFTFFLCMVLLVTMSISYLFTFTSVSTEKAAVWFVLFLMIGVLQQWKE